MHVLLVEALPDLGSLWAEHMLRSGATVTRVSNQVDAEQVINLSKVDVMVLDMTAEDISVVTLSDLAAFRQPDIAIIAVSSDTFFSNGSIFNVIPNVCGIVSPRARPDDLTAMVEHYGRIASEPALRRAVN